MDGWLLVVAVILVFGLVGIAAVRLAGRLRAPQRVPVSPSDEAELDAIFAAVSAEETPRTMAVLAQTLQGLVARRVPLRYVRHSAQAGLARLGFADGTVVVARTEYPGSIAKLFRATEAGGVHAERLRVHADHVELDLVWPTGQVPIRVLGRDQAD